MTDLIAPPLLPARIAATASWLPGVAHSTASLAAVAMPDRPAADVEARTGIRTRHFAAADETFASQAAVAVRLCLQRAELPASALKRLIFVSSTGGDCNLPANGNAVLELLGIADTVDCFDLNNACVGFLSALDVAARCVATGLGPVAVVASEMGSRHIDPSDPRPYVVFGDAAAAAIVTAIPPGSSAAVLASAFGNRGELRDTVTMAHGGLTGQRETIRFSKSNQDISAIALAGLRISAERALTAAGLSWGDVDWFVPHQPNGALLAAIVEEFCLDAAKVVPMVQDVGNVGAASTAVGLDWLLQRRQVTPGQIILLFGVGSGLSHGALVYRVG